MDDGAFPVAESGSFPTNRKTPPKLMSVVHGHGRFFFRTTELSQSKPVDMVAYLFPEEEDEYDYVPLLGAPSSCQ